MVLAGAVVVGAAVVAVPGVVVVVVVVAAPVPPGSTPDTLHALARSLRESIWSSASWTLGPQNAP